MRLSDTPSPILNHAFATQLGSGIYSVNGRSAYIYRLSLTAPLYKPESAAWSIRLRLPLTFGFINFQPQDIIDIDFPDHLATLSAVPTIECPIPMADNWWIEPSLGFGGGRDFSTRTSSYIYSAGIRIFAIFLAGTYDIRLGNRLVYAGYTTTNMSFVDDFGILETGVDVRRMLGYRIGSYDLDWSLFGVNMLYLISPHLLSINPEPINKQTEWEFGFTLGTHQPFRLFSIRMPRIGLSYRFSTKANAVRIIVGNPFPIDSPRRSGAEIL